MRYDVLLTEDAEQDLEDPYAYIAKFDSPKNADYVLRAAARSSREFDEIECAYMIVQPIRGELIIKRQRTVSTIRGIEIAIARC